MFGANVSKLKEEIVTKFEERFIEQNKKINQLLIKCDDNEQYSRRNCLRLCGIGSKKNEKVYDVW